MIGVGDTLPELTLPNDKGELVALKSLQGQPVVLFFYPKDDTPGCTKEACGFRDALPDFTALDCAVYGVSKDGETSHVKFRDKFELTFPLLSDVDIQLCEAVGVWKERSMYGKKFMGVERTTVLLDAAGVIRKIWRKVKVDGHMDEVLAELRSL